MISLGPTLGGDGDDVGLPQLGDGLHQGGRGEGREVGAGEGHWTAKECPWGEVKHLVSGCGPEHWVGRVAATGGGGGGWRLSESC